MSKSFLAMKKPIQVKAWEITYHSHDKLIPDWVTILTEWRTHLDDTPLLFCYCDTGLQTARPGDFLVCGYMNDVYPVPRSTFLNTHERI